MQGIDVSLNNIGARGNIALLKIKGFLDTTTSIVVSTKLKEVLNSSIYQLIIDMGGVNYVSSAGWGVFVGEIRSIRENGGDLKIVQMTPDVYEVFEMLEFDRILDYYDTIEESVNDFDICMGLDISNNTQRRKSEISTKEIDVSIPSLKAIATKTLTPGERKTKSRFTFTKHKINEAALPLVEKIKLIVIDNPNDGVFKVKKTLNTNRFGYEKVSAFKVFDIFRRYNLETKEKRHRFYRSR